MRMRSFDLQRAARVPHFLLCVASWLPIASQHGVGIHIQSLELGSGTYGELALCQESYPRIWPRHVIAVEEGCDCDVRSGRNDLPWANKRRKPAQLTEQAVENVFGGPYRLECKDACLNTLQHSLALRGGGSPGLHMDMVQALDDAIRQKKLRDDADRQQKAVSGRIRTVRLVNERLGSGLQAHSAELIYIGNGLRLRQATVMDVQDLMHINLVCLPENYQTKYYWHHLEGWPKLAWVAEAAAKRRGGDGGSGGTKWKIVAYVLGKLNEETTRRGQSRGEVMGHVTSLAVLRSHRRKSIARRLMILSMRHMQSSYNATKCSLHVRAGNRAAIKLYNATFGFHISDVDNRYYADGEDAYSMVAEFDRPPCSDLLSESLEHQ